MHLPTVAFQPGLSKVQQIVDALSQAIDQGLLNPGSKLPSAREMTAHWGVSKFTLIEALDRLRGQDRITSVRAWATLLRRKRCRADAPLPLTCCRKTCTASCAAP